jgi:hypothetical protein
MWRNTAGNRVTAPTPPHPHKTTSRRSGAAAFTSLMQSIASKTGGQVSS